MSTTYHGQAPCEHKLLKRGLKLSSVPQSLEQVAPRSFVREPKRKYVKRLLEAMGVDYSTSEFYRKVLDGAVCDNATDEDDDIAIQHDDADLDINVVL